MAEKKDSKKDKKPTKKRKKSLGGKQVPRPASKKPRPKKLVEAKIPNNPPVSTEEEQTNIMAEYVEVQAEPMPQVQEIILVSVEPTIELKKKGLVDWVFGKLFGWLND